MNSVALSPNSMHIVSASDDTTLKLCNVDSGKCIQTFEGHSYLVTSVAFSSNGMHIVSASDDSTVKLWDVDSGKCVQTFEQSDGVESVAFRPQPKLSKKA